MAAFVILSLGRRGEHRMVLQPGFFDLDERYAALSKNGDPLQRLSQVVDFEVFRADLERSLNRSDGSRGGRPPMDAVMVRAGPEAQALPASAVTWRPKAGPLTPAGGSTFWTSVQAPPLRSKT